MIRVLLVDDQELVRVGLRRILHEDEGFEIVGDCSDGDEVEAAVERLHPDLVVMDIRMKRVDGVEATRRLRAHDDAPPVLVLTTFDDDEVLAGTLRAGASGFQLKDARGEDLVRAAHDGRGRRRVARPRRHGAGARPHINRATSRRAVRSARPARSVDGPRARRPAGDRQRRERTRRSRESLFLSEATVKSHIGHIFTKLGLHDRAAAIVFAFDHRLVVPRS